MNVAFCFRKVMLPASGSFKTNATGKKKEKKSVSRQPRTQKSTREYVVPISDSTSKFLKAEVCKCHGKTSSRLLNLQEPICECVWRFSFSSTLETFIIQHFISILVSLFMLRASAAPVLLMKSFRAPATTSKGRARD